MQASNTIQITSDSLARFQSRRISLLLRICGLLVSPYPIYSEMVSDLRAFLNAIEGKYANQRRPQYEQRKTPCNMNRRIIPSRSPRRRDRYADDPHVEQLACTIENRSPCAPTLTECQP